MMVAVDFLRKRFPIRRAVLDMRGQIAEMENKIIFYMYLRQRKVIRNVLIFIIVVLYYGRFQGSLSASENVSSK